MALMDTSQLDQLFRKTKGGFFSKKSAGFLARILCVLEFSWDDTIDTACTNGIYLKWNPNFFLSLDAQTRITVLAHELWHVAFLHMNRRGNRDPDLWNIAADIVINNKLHEDGYTFNTDHIHEPQYRNMSTEEVYDILDKQSAKIKIPAAGLLPEDIEEAGTKEDKQAVFRSVVGAYVMAGKDAGNMPGEVKQTIEAFLHPILPWERLLEIYLTEITDQDRSYARPNRRIEDPILPSVLGRSGLEHLIYFLDISGSISDRDILRFNSELKRVKELFNPEKMTVVTFDTIIHDIYVFEKDDPFEKLVITGRGGTALDQVVKYANKHEATAVIVFTDLEVSFPQTRIKAPTLWICTNNARKRAPYGKTIHITER
jgi:predicted metal-dependent peptidase